MYQRTGLTGTGLEGLTKQIITFNRITKDSPLNVEQLTKVLAGFNIPAAQMGKILDQLFITSQKTGVPLSEAVGTLETAGPIARQFGFSISVTAGLLSETQPGRYRRQLDHARPAQGVRPRSRRTAESRRPRCVT